MPDITEKVIHCHCGGEIKCNETYWEPLRNERVSIGRCLVCGWEFHVSDSDRADWQVMHTAGKMVITIPQETDHA